MKKWMTKNGLIISQLLKGWSNVYVISAGDRSLLVDTGIRRSRKALEDRLGRMCAGGTGLTGLVLTHAHFDHAANAAAVKQKFNVPVIAHKDEEKCLNSGNTRLPGGTIPLTRLLVRIGNKTSGPVCYDGVDCDVKVEERMDLNGLGFNAYLLHTPGHTSGSVSLIADNEIAIVGDAMFGLFRGSVFPPFADDPRQTVESWRKLLDTGSQLFLPSHGTCNTRDLLQRQYIRYKGIYGI